MSSTNDKPLFKGNGTSDHGDSGVAVDETIVVAPAAAPIAAATVDDSASSAGSIEDRQRGGSHLIARVLQQGSPRRKGKGRKAAATAGGSSSSSSAALDFGHRRKSIVPDWGMAMDFSTIFRRKERLSVKDSLAVVGLKKALLIGKQVRVGSSDTFGDLGMT